MPVSFAFVARLEDAAFAFAGAFSGALSGGLRHLRGLAREARDSGQRVVRLELVAGGGQRLRRRPRHTDTDHVAAEALASLGERDVVRVTGDDDDVREVGQAEHVFDGIHGEADIRPVLGVGRGGEELHQIHGARDEL